MQSALTPHPLRQCNLTLALTDKPMHALCILPAYDISYDVTTVWVGDGYLIQTHQRATTPPQTHTHTTALHESPCPHPITPPCPSCRGTSLALCISSTSTISCSVAPRGLCLLLKADRWTHFICGFTISLSDHEWKIPR